MLKNGNRDTVRDTDKDTDKDTGAKKQKELGRIMRGKMGVRQRRAWGKKEARFGVDGQIVSYTYSFVTPKGTQSKYPDIHIPDRITKTFPKWDQGQGEVWLWENQKAIRRDIWVPPQVLAARAKQNSITFKDYAAKWLAARKNIRRSTRLLYEKLLRDHLNPAFGSVPIVQITAGAVQRWFDTFPVEKSGASGRWNCYSVLRAIMNSATRIQPDGSQALISKSPCIIQVSHPKVEHKVVIATTQEIVQLYNAMPEDLALSIYLAGILTLRRGEILGLERRDIDLPNNMIHIVRQAKPEKGADGKTHMVVTDPKTQGSIRDVLMPEHLSMLVKKQLDLYTGKHDTDFLFHGKAEDQPYSASAFGTRFRQARAKVPRLEAGLMHFHDLRHTAATEWINNGGSIRGGMGLSGHVTADMELHYEHASLREQKKILSSEDESIYEQAKKNVK